MTLPVTLFHRVILGSPNCFAITEMETLFAPCCWHCLQKLCTHRLLKEKFHRYVVILVRGKRCISQEKRKTLEMTLSLSCNCCQEGTCQFLVHIVKRFYEIMKRNFLLVVFKHTSPHVIFIPCV